MCPRCLHKILHPGQEAGGIAQVGNVGKENARAVQVHALRVSHFPVHHVVAVMLPEIAVILCIAGGIVEASDMAVIGKRFHEGILPLLRFLIYTYFKGKYVV